MEQVSFTQGVKTKQVNFSSWTQPNVMMSHKQNDEKEDWLTFGKVLSQDNMSYSAMKYSSDTKDNPLIETPFISTTTPTSSNITEQLVPTTNDQKDHVLEQCLHTTSSQDDLFQKQQEPNPSTLTTSLIITPIASDTCANTCTDTCADTCTDTCADTCDNTSTDTCVTNRSIQDEDVHCVPDMHVHIIREKDTCNTNSDILNQVNYTNNLDIKEKPVVSYRVVEEDKEELEDELDDIILSQESLIHTTCTITKQVPELAEEEDMIHTTYITSDVHVHVPEITEYRNENPSDDKKGYEKEQIAKEEIESYQNEANKEEIADKFDSSNNDDFQYNHDNDENKQENEKDDTNSEHNDINDDMCVPEIIDYIVNNKDDELHEENKSIISEYNNKKDEPCTHTDNNKSITLDCLSSFNLTDISPQANTSLFSFQQGLPPLSKSQLMHSLDSTSHHGSPINSSFIHYNTPPQWKEQQSTSPPYKKLKPTTHFIEDKEKEYVINEEEKEEEEEEGNKEEYLMEEEKDRHLLKEECGENEEINDGYDTVLQALPTEQAKEYSPHLNISNDNHFYNDNDNNNNDDDENNSFSLPNPTTTITSNVVSSIQNQSCPNDTRVSIGTMTMSERMSVIKEQPKKESRSPIVPPYKSVLKRGYLTDLVEPSQFNLSKPKLRLGLSKRSTHQSLHSINNH